MGYNDRNILVVDDDINLRELLLDTLNSIGYRAEAASDGFEALERLQKTDFDLVISDVKMPGMDGVTLLKKIRRHHPDMPVLFITGVVAPEIIGQASPDGFLAKPFRISHMEQLIEDALVGRKEQSARPINKVMIVDDDDLFREMLTETLNYNGFTPYAVEGGPQALRELKNGPVDAVIADIKMPEMDGLTLARRLKDQYPELPVILITAYLSRDEMDSQVREAGVDGFLQKPFDTERIVELLRSLSPGRPES